MRPTNELVLTLAEAYTHGTSTYLAVAEDLAALIAAGELETVGVVRVFDDDEWAIVRYGGVDTENNRLTDLSPAAPKNASDGADAHEFAVGSPVWGGVAADYIRELFDDQNPSTQALGDSPSPGTAEVAARRDHKHGMPSFATPAITLGSSAAAGSAGTVIRSDATIAAFDTTAPSTQAIGDIAATGSAAYAARRDHKHGMPGFATPAITLGTTAAAGSATTLIRSDATIAAFDAIAPSTQAFGDSPSVGTAAVAARRDHKHGMPALAGTFSDKAYAHNNTDYTTGQIRNIFISTGNPTGGGNGDIWLKREA